MLFIIRKHQSIESHAEKTSRSTQQKTKNPKSPALMRRHHIACGGCYWDFFTHLADHAVSFGCRRMLFA
jgi:hypothetical protein